MPRMSNHKEEQELELEALESIFEEGKEFEKISDTEFLLKFKPFPQDEEENFVGVTLRIAYTDEYPDVAPEWELKDVWQISDPKIEELKSKVEESIQESLGMAMVYTIAEMCQDWLKENNVKALSMHEEMMLRCGGDEAGDDEEDEDNDSELDQMEEEEWKGLKEKPLCAVSERLTVESFAEWKAKFDEEMIAAGIFKDTKVAQSKTGRQIFLDAQADEAAASKASGGNKESGTLVYNAALFGEEDDDDLDDLMSDEDEDTPADGYPAK